MTTRYPLVLNGAAVQEVQSADNVNLSLGVNLPLATGVTGVLPAANGGTGSSAGVDVVIQGTAHNFSAQQYFGETTLTYNATQAWAVNTNQVTKVTLTGNVTFSAPTGQVAGAFYSIAVIQDATGSRTGAWNSVFKFTSGIAPTLTTTANAKDYFTFRSDGTNMYEQGRSQGVA